MSDRTSHALTIYEKKILAEFRSFATACKNEIAEYRRDFAGKGSFGLWRDAKGLFKSSNKADVLSHMARFESMYEVIFKFASRVEKGDPDNYDELLAIYDYLEEAEHDAQYEVSNNPSKTVCRMLREFLDKKFHRNHSLKKVECVVLRQKTRAAEQACQRARDDVIRMSKKMDELIQENRLARLESDARMRQAVEEASRKSEVRFQAMAEQNRDILNKMTEILEKMSVH